MSENFNYLFAEMLGTMEFTLEKRHEKIDDTEEEVDCYHIIDLQKGWDDRIAVDAVGVIEEQMHVCLKCH